MIWLRHRSPQSLHPSSRKHVMPNSDAASTSLLSVISVMNPWPQDAAVFLFLRLGSSLAPTTHPAPAIRCGIRDAKGCNVRADSCIEAARPGASSGCWKANTHRRILARPAPVQYPYRSSIALLAKGKTHGVRRGRAELENQAGNLIRKLVQQIMACLQIDG